MLLLPPPPSLHLAACCTVSLRACRLTRGFVVLPPGGKAARQGEGPGPVVADVWLLQRKRAMREYGNVCSEWHHARLARPHAASRYTGERFSCVGQGEG